MSLPNPLIPGFHPDPSVVRVGDDYYLANSTFEYLPGITIHHSRDLVRWTLIGHVVTRTGQLQMQGVPTSGGAWAPTIRWRDGIFHVVVADAMGRGLLLFTATDPAGPWSDGLPIEGISGIDPDIAWDDDGTCYMTYSGLVLDGPDTRHPDTRHPDTRHHGIQQARVDLATGRALEEPRSIWSGTGLMFPEAPHLYRIGQWWYLLIAEGGTERGHAVSIARGDSPAGPFTGCPANPVLSARSTDRPIQNTGHGDFVQAPDGSWHIVLLGMRTRGMTRSFSALGRETFATSLEWVDEWPVISPVTLSDDVAPPAFIDEFDRDVIGPEWIAVRRLPMDIARLDHGMLRISGEGRTMDHPEPTFVGHRQRRLDARITATVVESGDSGGVAGVGGLTVRYDERHHYDIEIDGLSIVARASVATIRTEHRTSLPAAPFELFAEMAPPRASDPHSVMTCDVIHLGYEAAGSRVYVGSFDGRFLSAETTCSFTGRVVGLYSVTGALAFGSYREERLA